ncbi:DEAD/DEAH box helicase [Loktanella salsilacus]|uniref:DEAD/DEAH box helicase n=1 Tax=Loktanella salsilacus TaxID=195913 RepID=UPI0020B8CB97|nr:DEAD/DEAH box helicase [Loktanella salsilacus]UTH47594.1 DEAD/DEAH box helicase [Loktanella salsilacus]
MRHSTYAAALSEISTRAASAIVARGNLRSNAARTMLLRRLSADPGTNDSLIADPIYEAARVWKLAAPMMSDLSGTLLRHDIVDALAAAGEQAIPRDRHPYSHQLSSWQHTAAGKSVMVTSGTGSGKTECFMVPMLNDLVTQAETGPRHGVRGIVLYPLNALIESQRERLSAWIAPFDGKVSYALYNGDTPNDRSLQKPPSPAEIADRKTLRKTPANLLVTNVTMLEYMLTRSQDRNILAKSEGLLRWIVLDEAHTYIGAQAAEMALLLRRVRQAFGVRGEEVRLIATSATIGEGAETVAALRRFVADLGGVPETQVEVILGEERQPNLPTIGFDQPFDRTALETAEPASLWSQLASHPRARKARERMRIGGATLRDLSAILSPDTAPEHRDPLARYLLDAMAQAQEDPGAPALAPWRLNVFHRAQAGLFACIDPDCAERAPELCEDGSDWPFGQIYLFHTETCRCGAPTFEVTACSECGTPWLLAQLETGKARILRQSKSSSDEDDFHLDVEPDDVSDGPVAGADVVLGAPRKGLPTVPVRLSDAVVRDIDTSEPGHVTLGMASPKERGCCDAATTKFCHLGAQRFGAPFLLGSAFPLLLDTMPPLERQGSLKAMPFGGRRLLSFTDSRQGTARFSAKLQKEAERNLTRAAIWHSVQSAGQGDPIRAAELRDHIAKLQDILGMDAVVAEFRAALTTAEGGAGVVLWRDMINLLASNPELTGFAGDTWRSRPYGGKTLSEEPAKLAELFLLSEMFRRPRLQNNAETLGLVRLVFPELERKARAKPLPAAMKEAGHCMDDWVALLSMAIDNEFRGRLAVCLDKDDVDFAHWVSPRQGTNVLLGPEADRDSAAPYGRTLRWPLASQDRNRLVRMVYAMTGGTSNSGADRTSADEILAALWTALQTSGILRDAGPGAWQLDLRKSALARQDTTWQCPLTQRLLPYSCAGYSPNAIDGPRLIEIQFPRLPNPSVNGLTATNRSKTVHWLATDPVVANLRNLGLWSDIHDRAALFAPFLRAQEHSGQIDRNSLKTYEDQFKVGRINILNCSTTMEMGVDIPDVGTVVNTNVPPAPSNYRQRIGRAGRRGEPWALSFTFCKDKPLDWQVFRAPQRFLAATIPAPAVRLDSPIIVGRHVNSLLFGMFLREAGGADVTMKIGGFFGAPKELDQPWAQDAMADQFVSALASDWPTQPEVKTAVADLVLGTALQGLDGLSQRTLAAFSDLRARWRQEFETLAQGWAAAKDGDIERGFYANRARKMRNDTLMSELARRGFAPAYGFPVDVVEFNRLRDDSTNRSPSRQLDIAIRDYAPGSEVVIDGLVHRSDGILPAWSNRFDPHGVEDLRSRWTCPECFAFGVSRHRIETCPECDAIPRQTEILRPSGFLSRSKPHTSFEAVRFVAPDRPRIAAGHAAWQALANPSLGRMRTSRTGQVLYTASGGSFGYAICITCGLAHPEDGNASETALPKAMANHFPLMPPSREGARRDGFCPACDAGSRRIRRNVVLGHEIATDVFELQIDVLNGTEEGRDRALCIAAALREVLSQHLGIEAEEIGIGAEPSLREDGQKRMSLFLYDRSSGGSGFSPFAAERLPQLLAAAADRLTCPSRCSNGCPDCVLRGDIQYDQDHMNRPGALETVAYMLPLLQLSPERQIFGPSTQPLTQQLGSWLAPRLLNGRVTDFVLYLHGTPEEWSLPDLLNCVPSFVLAGVAPSIAIEKGAIASMDMAQRLDLLRLLSKTGATLRCWDVKSSNGDLPLLCHMTLAGIPTGVASPDLEAAIAGEFWGRTSNAPLLIGPYQPPILSKPISPEKVATFREGDTVRSEITAEFDGPLVGFGTRFWAHIRNRRPQVFAGSSPLASITYSDRYLRDPVSALLLAQILAKTPGRQPATTVSIKASNLPVSDRYLQRNLQDDWQVDRLRKEVLESLNPGAQIIIADYKNCPHRRQFTLEWQDGRKIDIALDQGVGAWTLTSRRKISYDVSALASDQIRSLQKINDTVTLRDGPSTCSILWLSWDVEV